jgi:hypothetical protein
LFFGDRLLGFRELGSILYLQNIIAKEILLGACYWFILMDGLNLSKGAILGCPGPSRQGSSLLGQNKIAGR